MRSVKSGHGAAYQTGASGIPADKRKERHGRSASSANLLFFFCFFSITRCSVKGDDGFVFEGGGGQKTKNRLLVDSWFGWKHEVRRAANPSAANNPSRSFSEMRDQEATEGAAAAGGCCCSTRTHAHARTSTRTPRGLSTKTPC